MNPLIVRAGIDSGRMQDSYRALGLAGRAKLGRRWFRRYELVCPIQVENWYCVRGCVDPRRAVIHLMSNAIQHDHDLLAPLRGTGRYNLVLFNEAQRRELEGIDHDALLWPLAMDLADRPALPVAIGSRRIGVFTRLSEQKPIEPLLYAFQSLRQLVPDVELHVFGGGTPEVYGRTLDLLRLRDVVRFRGHAPDMVAALRDERIALCWMFSFDEAIGYATIEVASVGVPVLCWNFAGGTTEEIARASGGAVEAYGTVVGLVEATSRLLHDRRALEVQGATARIQTFRRHHLPDTIGTLEAYYARISSTSG